MLIFQGVPMLLVEGKSGDFHDFLWWRAKKLLFLTEVVKVESKYCIKMGFQIWYGARKPK